VVRKEVQRHQGARHATKDDLANSGACEAVGPGRQEERGAAQGGCRQAVEEGLAKTSKKAKSPGESPEATAPLRPLAAARDAGGSTRSSCAAASEPACAVEAIERGG
jgi:hypothetical protein